MGCTDKTRMAAKDGEHDLVTNFDCVCYECMWVSLCVHMCL